MLLIRLNISKKTFASRIRNSTLSDDPTTEKSSRRLSEKLLHAPTQPTLNTFQGFNYSLLESDLEFQDFVRSLMPVSLKSSFGERKREKNVAQKTATARKFFTVKHMIMYFQKTPLFGKFAFYGCWCFPDGPEDIDKGYGEPVDEIDRNCKKLSQCYRCSQMEFGKEKCPANSDYKFQGVEDPVTGRRYVDCLDTEGTCSRSMCECDKQLAETIAGLENEWKEENHAKWGGFRREHECRTPTNWGKEMRIQVYGSKNNGNQPDACCGRPGERFPFFTDSGKRGCCGSRTFNSELMKCCPSPQETPKIRPHSAQC